MYDGPVIKPWGGVIKAGGRAGSGGCSPSLVGRGQQHKGMAQFVLGIGPQPFPRQKQGSLIITSLNVTTIWGKLADPKPNNVISDHLQELGMS